MTMTALVLTLFTTHAHAGSAADEVAAEALVQAWAIGAGAYFGGATGYLIGETLEVNEEAHTIQGVGVGAAVGAGIGGTAAVLVGEQLDLTNDEAVLLASGTGVGIFAGTELGRALIPADADAAKERAHAAGLAGAMAGTGIGFLAVAPDLEHTLHFDLATGVGAIAAGGIGDAAGWQHGEHQQARAGLNLAGAATLGGVSLIYNGLAEETPNPAAWGLALGHGAWIGAWAPYLFSDAPEELEVLGGVRAGVGLGYAGALLIATAGNPDSKTTALQSIGMASGTALGAGIPLAMGGQLEGRDVAGPMLASGVAGQVLGAAVAPHYALSRDDAFLLGTLGAWTGYQAVGWATYSVATGQDATQPLGYALTAGGAGTLVGMALAPALDVPASASAMLLSSGGWGTWYGGWTANVLDLNEQDAWLMMMTSGNVALLGTAVAEGAGWQPTWRDVGTLDGYGLLGAAGGGLIGIIALYEDDDWDPMVTSTLLGSTVGLGVGAVVASRVGRNSESSRSLPEMQVGRGRWQPNMSARPWMDDSGKPGAWVELSLLEVNGD
jgi:hypothetical protein